MLLDKSGEGLEMPERGMGKRDVYKTLLRRLKNPVEIKSHTSVEAPTGAF